MSAIWSKVGPSRTGFHARTFKASCRDEPLTRTNPMLTAPIPVVLRQMTGPMIFGIIAILAFNLVDTFFIGMLGTEALAAISFTFPVTFVVTSLAMGLGAGLSAVIGHTLGQGKHDEAAHLATDSLFLAVIMVALLSTGGRSHHPASVYPVGRQYRAYLPHP